MITEDDKSCIYYYIKEKDITCWGEWKDKKAEIKREYPELVAALENLKAAKRTLDAVMHTLFVDTL